MNLTDRDRKIILILLIIAVVALPYVLYTKDTKAETDTINAGNIVLQERLSQLQEMDKNRTFYVEETARLNEERDAIVRSYPADVRPENYTMFLLNTEYSSLAYDSETGEPYLEYPVLFSAVSFGENSARQISAEGAADIYDGISNTSTLTYETYYDGFKYLIQYLTDYKDPMRYGTVSVAAEEGTGIISGSITLTQYAISGGGRELEPVEIWPDLDDLGLRGNEDYGVFGPLTDDDVDEVRRTIVEEEPTEEDAAEGAAAENTDN